MGIATGTALTGRTVAGKFRLGDRLADDPCGTLYKAVDLSTSRSALALVFAHGVRLEREKEARALVHPNLLRHLAATAAGDPHRAAIFDMPTGRSLALIISKRGPLHPGPSANVALQLLSALHAIHSQGAFHGNLNPSSVFVNRTDKGELEVNLAYPGALRVEAPSITAATFAPEQILGEGVDRRADIWAVGALLHLCLFGRPPFEGADWEEISGKILLKEPVFPEEAAAVPAELLDAIRDALAKSPDARPQSANNMIGALLATAEEYDEQMSELVAAALRASIPPAPTAAKPTAPKPVAAKTVLGIPGPKPAKPAEPKPAIPQLVVPPPASLFAAEAGEKRAVEAPAEPPPPQDEHARAEEAAAISAALESALEIDLSSMPPEPLPGSGGAPAPRGSSSGKKLFVFAALASVILVAAAVAFFALRGGGETPSQAPPVSMEPPKAREPAEVIPAPVVAPSPAPPPATEKPAAPAADRDESPPPPADARPGSIHRTSPGKRSQQPSHEKKPAAPKGAQGLASNPFGG
jgi:hypothetical protein